MCSGYVVHFLVSGRGTDSSPPVLLSNICAIWQPVRRAKVDSLCTVEACVEARVVGIGESDHKGALLMHHPMHWHPSCLHTHMPRLSPVCKGLSCYLQLSTSPCTLPLLSWTREQSITQQRNVHCY